jgi:hypothetical protein
MSRKVDGARRCADLLAALARTANVRLALREAGISACWAYRRRKADPDFDARWRTAVRAGRRDLAKAAAALARDPRVSRPGGKAEMLTGSSGKGTLRLERVKPCSFTDGRRATFLQMLRATCNVRAAARAAGVSAQAAYTRYHADAGFRAAWDAARVEGRMHLEMAMIGAARALIEPPGEQPGAAGCAPPAEQSQPVIGPESIKGMDAWVAMQMLRQHTPREAGGRARAQSVRPADAEETRRAILAKVAAVRAAREGGGPGSGPSGGAADAE